MSAHGKVYLYDSFFVSRNPVTVPKRLIHANGVVYPYVPNQWVHVKIMLGNRVIRSDNWRLRPSKNGRYGWFRVPFSSPGVGGITVEVTHKTNHAVRSFKVNRSLAALDTNVSFGSGGRFVQLIQQRLAALHFYIPQTGVYDSGTGWAVDAYHRLLRRGTSQNLDGVTISYLLNGWGEFKLRYPQNGAHAEGNLGLQLLALANGSHVDYILPISSGKPSTPTILGNFQVYSPGPRLPARRHVLLELLLQRVRDPRLRPRARLPRQPWLHAPADPGRDLRLQLAELRGLGRLVLLGVRAPA